MSFLSYETLKKINHLDSSISQCKSHVPSCGSNFYGVFGWKETLESLLDIVCLYFSLNQLVFLTSPLCSAHGHFYLFFSFLYVGGAMVSFRSMERLTYLCCILLVLSFCLFSFYVWLRFLDRKRRKKGNHTPSAENSYNYLNF